MKTQQIYLLGIDGSGKTTLAKALVEKINERNIQAQYFYGQHFAIFLAPLRWFTKKTFMKTTSFEKDYKNYSKTKTKMSSKYRLFAYIYSFVWLFDYFFGTIFRKLFLIKRISKIIVFDRYFIDIVVNISQTLNLSESHMFSLLKISNHLFPMPNHIFYIDIPEEIAFLRKTDVPSIEYLIERSARYEKIIQIIPNQVVDGSQAIDKIIDSIWSGLELEFHG